MIIRVFSALLKPGKRPAYERLCRDVVTPLMLAHPGCLTVHIGAPRDERPDDFVFVSIWEDVASIQAFVGEQWQQASIVPGEADLLREVAVHHYDGTYRSLVALWRAVATVIKRREVGALAAPLNEAQWEQLRPLLPAPAREGRPRANDRRTLEGILYVLRTGCRWHDLPATYGSAVTCWRRFTRWEADGTWERIWRALFATLDAQGKRAWALTFLDSHFIPTKRDSRFVPTKRGRWRSA